MTHGSEDSTSSVVLNDVLNTMHPGHEMPNGADALTEAEFRAWVLCARALLCLILEPMSCMIMLYFGQERVTEGPRPEIWPRPLAPQTAKHPMRPAVDS